MNDRITREQAEERLKSSNVKALRAEVLDMLFPAPSPHPFIPKEGEVIAVRWDKGSSEYFQTFVTMLNNSYMGKPNGDGELVVWRAARPLTDKERRI